MAKVNKLLKKTLIKLGPHRMMIRQLGVAPAYNKTGHQIFFLFVAGPLKLFLELKPLINQVFTTSSKPRWRKPNSAKCNVVYTENSIRQGFQIVFPTICNEKTPISSIQNTVTNVLPRSTRLTLRQSAADLFISWNHLTNCKKKPISFSNQRPKLSIYTHF